MQSKDGNSSLVILEHAQGLCEVFTVVELPVIFRTCDSTPAVIEIGCTAIHLLEPTCVDTTIVISLTITEGGDAVDGQIQTGDLPATGPPPYVGYPQRTKVVQVLLAAS